MIESRLISLHGGHSGQFCCHAEDRLEDLIQAYIAKGFKAVGISEHMPPPEEKFLYPDEVKNGLTVQDLEERFAQYFQELDRLKEVYKKEIQIFKGFETETVTGSAQRVRAFIRKYAPDYIVGSVHHVYDRCFDYSPRDYNEIVQQAGSVQDLYIAYFDAQYEMIKELKPFVVGHFDLIRIFDPGFEEHMELVPVRKCILRNLALIKDLGLVLDYNLRPLWRGEKAAYLAPMILEQARALNIPLVPGDDAHSRKQAGMFVSQAVDNLEQMGFPTQWPRPRSLTEV